MIAGLQTLEVVTVFVDDLAAARTFYAKVFGVAVVYEDEVSCVMEFGSLMINLLSAPEAPKLVKPLPVAPSGQGSRVLFTIKVADVDAIGRALEQVGVALVNGPIDRPWGRRTAAFADPSGLVWEIAQELTAASS